MVRLFFLPFLLCTWNQSSFFSRSRGGNLQCSPNLRSLEELSHYFENLLEGLRSDVKLPAEFLLVQYAIENLNPLQVRLRVAHVVHQVTSELVAPWQLDFDTVGLSDPELHLELHIADWGPLIDLAALTILIS